jgi:hypothetical protein
MLVVLKSPKFWLLLLIVAGYIFLPKVLPPRFEQKISWHPEERNWFGQPGWTAFLYAAGLLIVLCALRLLILRKSRGPIDAAAWYCLVLSAFVPAVWLFVVTDWDNEAVAETACWVGYPIALLFVPTAVFLFDLITHTSLAPGVYLLRSVGEICLLVPNWCVFWVIVESLILGWIGP